MYKNIVELKNGFKSFFKAKKAKIIFLEQNQIK